MYEFDTLLNAFITMLVTIDPVGLAPLFLGLTNGMTRAQRNAVGLRAVVIALLIMALFVFAGLAILNTLGITIPAFRVAGGLLLFYISFEMVFGLRQERKAQASREAIDKDHIANLAVFPLALPLIAGPGAISAAIILSDATDGGSLQWRFVLLGLITAIMGITLLSFMAAGFIDKYLGQTGRTILTRLLGVLLSALSVQFVVDGMKALLA